MFRSLFLLTSASLLISSTNAANISVSGDPTAGAGAFSLYTTAGTLFSSGCLQLGTTTSSLTADKIKDDFVTQTTILAQEITLEQGTLTMGASGDFSASASFKGNAVPETNSSLLVAFIGNGSDASTSSEFSMFIFRSTTDDSQLTWQNLKNIDLTDLLLVDKATASSPDLGLDYYAECIMGTVDPNDSTKITFVSATQSIPEPTTATLSLLGLTALMLRRRRA